MRKPINAWSKLWRTRQFVIHSPLPAQEVRAAISARLGADAGDGRVVAGTVGPSDVRLVARHPAVRNSWRPALAGRLVPSGAGCQLNCSVGWPPAVRIFSAVWLGLAVLFLLCDGVSLISVAAAGHLDLREVAVDGAPLLMIVFFVLLVTFGSRMGRRDEEFLRGWLGELMHETPSPLPGA